MTRRRVYRKSLSPCDGRRRFLRLGLGLGRTRGEARFRPPSSGSGFASFRRGVVSSFFSSSFDSFASDATPKTSFAGPRPVLSPSQRHAFPSAASTDGAQVA